jgi:hypothetical protein
VYLQLSGADKLDAYSDILDRYKEWPKEVAEEEAAQARRMYADIDARLELVTGLYARQLNPVAAETRMRLQRPRIEQLLEGMFREAAAHPCFRTGAVYALPPLETDALFRDMFRRALGNYCVKVLETIPVRRDTRDDFEVYPDDSMSSARPPADGDSTTIVAASRERLAAAVAAYNARNAAKPAPALSEVRSIQLPPSAPASPSSSSSSSSESDDDSSDATDHTSSAPDERIPSDTKSVARSVMPSDAKSVARSVMPSDAKSVARSVMPSDAKSVARSVMPSDTKSVARSVMPSDAKSVARSVMPSDAKSVAKSVMPSDAKSVAKSVMPSDTKTVTKASDTKTVTKASDAKTVAKSVAPSDTQSMVRTILLSPTAPPPAVPLDTRSSASRASAGSIRSSVSRATQRVATRLASVPDPLALGSIGEDDDE